MKLKLSFIFLIVIGIICTSVSAFNTFFTAEQYAVGGELVPITSNQFLSSSVTLALVIISIVVIGGALIKNKISYKIVSE
jgi:hypothetical protein